MRPVFAALSSAETTFGSIALSYGVTTALYVFGIGMIATFRSNTAPERQDGHPIALLREGFSYVWTNRLVFGAILLDLAAVRLGGRNAAVAGLCPRHSAHRPAGFRASARRVRHRRARHGGVAVVVPGPAQGRGTS